MLGYVAAFTASFVAVGGIYVTLAHASKSQQEQVRMGVIPCISLTLLQRKGLRSHFTEEESADSKIDESGYPPKYEELERDCLIVVLDNSITYRSMLTDEQKKNVIHRDSLLPCNEGVAFFPNPVIYIPVRFRNVGAGAAISLRIGVFCIAKEDSSDKDELISMKTFDCGESFYMGIYIDTSKENIFGDYLIVIDYLDILGYRYRQYFPMEICAPDNKKAQEKGSVYAYPHVNIEYRIKRVMTEDSDGGELNYSEEG